MSIATAPTPISERVDTITIDIWSDVVCPWCWLGKRRLEQALDDMGLKDSVEVRYRAYELGERNSLVEPLPQAMAKKFGSSPEAYLQRAQRLVSLGAEIGLNFDFERAIRFPTYDTHRLIQLAAKHQLGHAMMERLHLAYFSEGEDLSDARKLKEFAVECGLPAGEVDEVLSSNAFGDVVDADEDQARRFGVGGVPFFVFDERYAVEGAQPVEVFVEALTRARADHQSHTIVGGDSNSAVCTDDECELPS